MSIGLRSGMAAFLHAARQERAVSMTFNCYLAYQWAADLEKAHGNPVLATDDQSKALALKALIRAKYWDESRGLFADNTSHRDFSQQTNTLAVLAGVSEGPEGAPHHGAHPVRYLAGPGVHLLPGVPP